MLDRFRRGDANMHSWWISSRNHATGNIAVVAVPAGVFGIGSAWPDLVVAAVLATLGSSGGMQFIQQARSELAGERTALQPAE